MAAAAIIVAATATLALEFPLRLDALRGPVERAVQRSTGRAFHLRGALTLSLVPVLGLQLGEAELDNPPQVPGPPLLRWSSARVGFEFLPLLHHRLIVHRLQIDGLRIDLQRTAGGLANWDLSPAGAHAGAAPGIAALELAGLEVRNGVLKFVDLMSARRFELSQLRLSLGPIRVAERLTSGPVELRGRLFAGAAPAQGFPFALRLEAVSATRVPLSVEIPSWSLASATVNLSGALHLSAAQTPWSARGSLAVNTSSVRQLLAQWGIGSLRTSDGTVLGALTASAAWRLASGILTIEPFALHMDGTALGGSIVADASGAKPQFSLHIRGDHVDLDRYISSAAGPRTPLESQVAALRALRIAGAVSFGEVRYRGTVMKGVRIEIPPPS